MRLTQIDFNVVQADCDPGPATKYNTCFCPAEKLPQNLEVPSVEPYAIRRCLPLILETRGLNASDAQFVHLSRMQAQLLVDASASSIVTGHINRAAAEDLRDEVYPCFSQLQYPPQGLFMRLDGCSPKDATCRLHQGNKPQAMVLSTYDIVLRLSSSQRAMNDVKRTLASGATTVTVNFLPFQERMRSEREYRVFCVPNTGDISAISQYRWHKPWLFAKLPREEKEQVAQSIWNGVLPLHKRILEELNVTMESLDGLFLKQGFTFDVFYDEESGKMELIELNVFGARSGCGSCLFEWVEDFDQLYGNAEEVEFRIAC